MLFSIAITTYKRPKYLYNLLYSLEKADKLKELNKSFEIIVVDNYIDEDLLEHVKKRFPLVKYYKESIPGLSAAKNTSVKLCSSNNIAFLDDDEVVTSNYIEIVKKAALRDDKIIAGKMKNIFNRKKYYWITKTTEQLYSALDYGEIDRYLTSDEWISGGNIIIKKDFFLSLGGYNELLTLDKKNNKIEGAQDNLFKKLTEKEGYIPYYMHELSIRHFIEKERLSEEWLYKRAKGLGRSNKKQDLLTNKSPKKIKFFFEILKIYPFYLFFKLFNLRKDLEIQYFIHVLFRIEYLKTKL